MFTNFFYVCCLQKALPTADYDAFVDNNVCTKLDEQDHGADDTVAEAKTSFEKSDGLIPQADNSILKAENSILKAENSILKPDSSNVTESPICEADSEAFETSATDFELPFEVPSTEGDPLQKFSLKTSPEVVGASDSDRNAAEGTNPSTPSPVSEGGTLTKGNLHQLEGGSVVKGMKQSTAMLMSPEMQEQLLFHQMLTPHNLQLFQHQRNLLIKQNQVHVLN